MKTATLHWSLLLSALCVVVRDLRGSPDEPVFEISDEGGVLDGGFRAEIRDLLFGMSMVAGECLHWKTSETTQVEFLPLARVPTRGNKSMRGVWIVLRPC